jgi:peptide/nickel transport system permease protein
MSTATIAMIAVPPFVVAIYVLLVFSVGLQWFPATGLGTEGGILGQLHAIVLPAFALGLGWVGYIARLVRASAIETLGQPHITTARAFAIPSPRLVWAYVFRLAITPIVLLLAASIGSLLSSAVVIEIVFARSGIGKLTYDAVLARNFPVVMGCVVVTVVVFQIAVILGDLVVAALDPRTRRR